MFDGWKWGGGREGELHEANVVGVQPSHGSSYHICERSVNLVSLSLHPLVGYYLQDTQCG